MILYHAIVIIHVVINKYSSYPLQVFDLYNPYRYLQEQIIRNYIIYIRTDESEFPHTLYVCRQLRKLLPAEHVVTFIPLKNSHLFLQMDIITLYASGMVSTLEALIPNKPYLILYMERLRVCEDFCTLVKLWEEHDLGSGRNIFAILPEEYNGAFSPTEMSAINNQSSFCKLILLGFSHLGKPVLQFRHYVGGTEV